MNFVKEGNAKEYMAKWIKKIQNLTQIEWAEEEIIVILLVRQPNALFCKKKWNKELLKITSN